MKMEGMTSERNVDLLGYPDLNGCVFRELID